MGVVRDLQADRSLRLCSWLCLVVGRVLFWGHLVSFSCLRDKLFSVGSRLGERNQSFLNWDMAHQVTGKLLSPFHM